MFNRHRLNINSIRNFFQTQTSTPWLNSGIATILIIVASIGLINSLHILSLEIEGIKNPLIYDNCRLETFFDCGIVVRTWQAQVFGFPNPILGILFYELLLLIGITSFFGFKPNRFVAIILLMICALALCFSWWLFYNSFFVIGVACVFCLISTVMSSLGIGILTPPLIQQIKEPLE